MPDQPHIERTLVIIKPDAVQRRLIGEIVSRIERKGLRIIAMKMMQIARPLAEKHYAVHKGKSFYEPLLEFITCAPVVVMIVEGRMAISVVRRMMGATNPAEADPGTIRADLALQTSYNLIHGSDSPATAEHEMNLFFTPDKFVSHPPSTSPYAFE